MAMVESHEADFAVFLTWKLTSKAGFAELSLCIREETSPGGGGENIYRKVDQGCAAETF